MVSSSLHASVPNRRPATQGNGECVDAFHLPGSRGGIRHRRLATGIHLSQKSNLVSFALIHLAMMFLG
jgi:hypothetical protein